MRQIFVCKKKVWEYIFGFLSTIQFFKKDDKTFNLNRN